MTIYGGVTITD